VSAAKSLPLVAALALAGVGCDRRPAVTSCDDDLHGVWITEAGAQWSLLDFGPTLQAFPLFDDAAVGGAPRVIDLERGQKLAGFVHRRFMQGATECVASAPIRIAKCKQNTLQIVIGEPQAPLSFTPCSWGKPAESRLEHWRRD
jgi:hypothetical protein